MYSCSTSLPGGNQVGKGVDKCGMQTEISKIGSMMFGEGGDLLVRDDRAGNNTAHKTACYFSAIGNMDVSIPAHCEDQVTV